MAYHPLTKTGGYDTQDDSSPMSVRRTLSALSYTARMITCNAAGLVTLKRLDGTNTIVYCVAGHNPYVFIQVVADAGNIVEDIHF